MKAAVAIREGNAFAVDALAKGDILNMSGKKGMTLLMYALLTATKKNRCQFSNRNRTGKERRGSIVHYSSIWQCCRCYGLKALIAGGLDKNAVSSARPLIMNATSENSMPVLEYLVSIGADVNKPDTAGKTALIFALTRMDLDQVEYLLHHGANPNAVTNAGWGFSNLLEDMLKKKGKNNDATAVKLMEIKRLAVAKGMRI